MTSLSASSSRHHGSPCSANGTEIDPHHLNNSNLNSVLESVIKEHGYLNFEDTMVESSERAGDKGEADGGKDGGSDPILQDFQTYEDTSLSTHLQNIGNQDDQDLGQLPDNYSSNIFQINQLDLNRLQHFGCK